MMFAINFPETIARKHQHNATMLFFIRKSDKNCTGFVVNCLIKADVQGST